jgi:hypothetical protein
VDDLSLKVDEINGSILLEARSKESKPWTGALGVACTQADTPTFECVLLDYLGHQDLPIPPRRIWYVGGGPSFGFEDGGTSLLC